MDTLKARELHDELLAAKPEGARHDVDICSFCVDKATQIAPAPSGPEATPTAPEDTEGGTTTAMSDEIKTISVETHEALLEKALREATSATEQALASKIEENTKLAAEVASLTETKTTLETDNARLNKELDTAQVSLKATADEVASMKAEKAAEDLAAQKAEIASKRAEQVKSLGLFEENFIAEKAEKWADLAEEQWAERVEEWSSARKAQPSSGDTASALTGTSGELTTEHTETASEKPTARRAALGL